MPKVKNSIKGVKNKKLAELKELRKLLDLYPDWAQGNRSVDDLAEAITSRDPSLILENVALMAMINAKMTRWLLEHAIVQ